MLLTVTVNQIADQDPEVTDGRIWAVRISGQTMSATKDEPTQRGVETLVELWKQDQRRLSVEQEKR